MSLPDFLEDHDDVEVQDVWWERGSCWWRELRDVRCVWRDDDVAAGIG